MGGHYTASIKKLDSGNGIYLMIQIYLKWIKLKKTKKPIAFSIVKKNY